MPSKRPAVTICTECGKRSPVPWQRGPVPTICGDGCHNTRRARRVREAYRREYDEAVAAALAAGGDDAGETASTV